MSLVNVFPEFKALHRFATALDSDFKREFRASMDLKETKDDYEVIVDVPGFTKEQIEIDVNGSSLNVKGHSEQLKEEDSHYHYRERVHSTFQRSIRLPLTINPETIKATLKDGVLSVTVPKTGSTSKRIEIQ